MAKKIKEPSKSFNSLNGQKISQNSPTFSPRHNENIVSPTPSMRIKCSSQNVRQGSSPSNWIEISISPTPLGKEYN